MFIQTYLQKGRRNRLLLTMWTKPLLGPDQASFFLLLLSKRILVESLPIISIENESLSLLFFEFIVPFLERDCMTFWIAYVVFGGCWLLVISDDMLFKSRSLYLELYASSLSPPFCFLLPAS